MTAEVHAEDRPRSAAAAFEFPAAAAWTIVRSGGDSSRARYGNHGGGEIMEAVGLNIAAG